MKVITFFNQKGGVGKSTLTFNIAYFFSLQHKTVMWDMDTQMALSLFTGIEKCFGDSFKDVIKKNKKIKKYTYETEWNNLFLIPSGENIKDLEITFDKEKKKKDIIKEITDEINGHFEYMFVDIHASKSLLIENILRASDYIFIPIIPNPVNLMLIEDNLNFIRKCKSENKIKGIIPNIVDIRKKAHISIMEKIKALYPQYNLNHFIPSCSKVEEVFLKNKPLELFAKKSKAAIAIKELFHIIHSRI